MPLDLPPVQAQIVETAEGATRTLRAVVTAASPRRLRWVMVVDAVGPSGRSTTRQSGHTQGATPATVSTTQVNANAGGQVELQVYDGEELVARSTLALGG